MLYYRYQPLQYHDSVRVLVLHPSLNNSDPIRCTIQHARLSDASLEYKAVSYTWGTTTQTQAIYLHHGARELYVRHNCYNALRRIRREHGDCLLWIDAICINQNNLKERARQVCIMDVIFSRASKVLVILSEPPANSDALFEKLATGDEILPLMRRSGREPPGDDVVQLLVDLFRDPWFERVWVLQEVFRKNSIRFLCGSASFSYSGIYRLYWECRGKGTMAIWPLALRWLDYPPEEFSTPQFNLWNRLYESRDYQATDPKDRVDALKSLTGSEQSVMDTLINYAQTVEECFIDVATFVLPVLGLRLLTAVRHPHDKKMPSWVPDWSQNLPLGNNHFSAEFPNAEDFQLVRQSGASDKQEYAVRPFLCKSHEIYLELLVTGCRYARIVDSSRAFQFVDTYDAERQMKRLYYHLINLRQYVNPEDMCDDLNVVVDLGRTIAEAMSSIDGLQLHLYLSRYQTCVIANGGLIDSECVIYFAESLQQCRISIMDNGELAIVPEAARSGDVICILSAAVSACVLRPSPDEYWSLVSGDCYIFREGSFIAAKQELSFTCDEYINQDVVEEFRLR